MIGYLIQQELGNELPFEKRLASLLTLIEVDADDPAFADPTKPIGPIYTEADADAARGARRAGRSSPTATASAASSPRRCRSGSSGSSRSSGCSSTDCVVICAGGGGIPVMYTDEPAPAGRRLVGVEAVIDKDLASALLASDLRADALADRDRRRRRLRRLGHAGAAGDPPRDARRRSPATEFAAGSMGPKVRAACSFVEQTGGLAAIGSIADTPALLRGEAGTTVTLDAAGLELGARSP